MPIVTIEPSVSSISKSGSTALQGAITLSEGSNITLTQSGQDIQISSSASGGITGTGVNNQVAVFSGASTVDSSSDFTYDGADFVLNASNSVTISVGTNFLSIDGTNVQVANKIIAGTSSLDSTSLVIGTTSLSATVHAVDNGFKIITTGACRVDFNSTDVKFNTTNVIITSTNWLGLGSSAGRFVFTDAATDSIDVTSADLNVALGLNVGTATGAGTGDIKASGALTVGIADSTNGTITSNVTNASGSTYLDSFVLNRYTSGTPAASLGGLIKTQLESSTNALQKALQIGWLWVDATNASRKSRAVFFIEDTATREAFRIEASGTAPMIGFLGANAAVQQTSGENLTNNVTSGGTTGTIANFTSLTTYSTDAATIRNDIYQLARKLKQVNDALRLYGLLT